MNVTLKIHLAATDFIDHLQNNRIPNRSPKKNITNNEETSSQVGWGT